MKKLLLLFILFSIVCIDGKSQDENPSQARLVKVLNPSGASGLQQITAFDDRLVFSANDGGGVKFWISQGVSLGTEAIFESPAFEITAAESYLIFRANQDLGMEPYFYNKGEMMPGEISLLKDINEGEANSGASNFTPIGDITVFTADDGVNGVELWVTDGTPDGTQLLKDINPGPTGSAAAQLGRVGDYVYFRANDGENDIQLWRTDGTTEGTVLVKIINEGGSANIFDINDFEGKAVFRADDGDGQQLWISDGTEGGTVKISDISGALSQISVAGGAIYFRGNNGNGNEPFISDGTLEGTVELKDINPGTGNSNPLRFVTLEDNTVLFVANDGTNNNEMWITDGTESGTQLLKIINPGGASTPNFPVKLNGEIYFSANNGSSIELWKTDGTEEGTVQLTEINQQGGSSVVVQLEVFRESIYFGANDGLNNSQFWRYGVPKIEVAYNDSDIESGDEVTLSRTLSQADEPIIFKVTNTGPVSLYVLSLLITAQEEIISDGGIMAEIAPGESADLTIIPDISAIGDYSFEIDLRTDDVDDFSFIINVDLSVEEDPVAGISAFEVDTYIYPNPAQGILNVKSTKTPVSSVRLFNLQGQTILVESLDQVFSHTLNIDSVKGGIYIIEITYSDGVISRDRIIKN